MIKSIILKRAEVAELVDALGSGSSGRMPVRVRLSPSAPQQNSTFRRFEPFFRGSFFRGQKDAQHFLWAPNCSNAWVSPGLS